MWLSSELAVLPDNSFYYFIPEILKAALNDLESVNIDIVVQNLFIPKFSQNEQDIKEKQRIEKRFSQFTPEQANLIADILLSWEKQGIGWEEEIKRSLPFWEKLAKLKDTIR
jgi:hypothetical protein